MSTLWNVVGNACSDDGFRQEVMGRVKYGRLALGDHEELYEFFRTQTPYCPTRWELIEVNRVMSHAGKNDGPMAQISPVWDPAPRQEPVLCVIGLGCVDDGLRRSLLAGSVEETRRALAEGPPRQYLTLSQTVALRDLLGRQSGDKTVSEWMQEVELVGWIPSRQASCEPGATYTDAYFHANPLIISALQDAQPLKKYLASEPDDRRDRPAIRAEVLRLLQEYAEQPA